MTTSGKKIYYPILKGKMGEFSALKELTPDQRKCLTPIIEVPPGAEIKSIITNIASNWTDPLPIMVDFSLIDSDPDTEPDADFNMGNAFQVAQQYALHLIPVTALSDLNEVALSEIHSRMNCGICFRLRSFDFEDGEIINRIREAISRLGIKEAEVDLLIDLGTINQDQSAIYIMAIAGMVGILSQINARRFILSSSAFPENLSGIARDSVTRVTRSDWLLWNAVIQRTPEARRPSYSDYAVAHPDLPNIDPKMMNPSASIRYTVDNEWIIVKGRGLRTEAGFTQFHELSKRLMQEPDFNQVENCWGDEFIRSCAAGGKTGNLTTWRKVGTNRHLCKVISQLSNRA